MARSALFSSLQMFRARKGDVIRARMFCSFCKGKRHNISSVPGGPPWREKLEVMSKSILLPPFFPCRVQQPCWGVADLIPSLL